MKKKLLLSVGIFTAIMGLVGILILSILLHYAEFQQGKAVAIIIFLLMIVGFGLTAFKCFKSVLYKNKTEQNSETTNFHAIEISAQSVKETHIEDEKLSPVPDTVSEQINEHPTEYIESGNTIYKINDQPISDEEVPYLIQIGYEKTLERENIQINLNEQEQQFFDELKNALSKIKRSISMQRMSNGVISVYSNTYYVGKIKLTGRKHWMQILRGETQSKTVDGEL